jgi:hypothetical protein
VALQQAEDKACMQAGRPGVVRQGESLQTLDACSVPLLSQHTNAEGISGVAGRGKRGMGGGLGVASICSRYRDTRSSGWMDWVCASASPCLSVNHQSLYLCGLCGLRRLHGPPCFIGGIG